MDIDKVRGLSDVELETEIANARRQLHDLRFQLATRQLTDHRQISKTRRTVARILTVQRERIAADAQEQAGGMGAGRGTATVGAR